MEPEYLGHIGSFIGGVATAFGLVSLVIVWLQWRRTRALDRAEAERARNDEQRAIRMRLRVELNDATRMVLVDRPNLYRDAFSTQRTDFMTRGVLSASAIRLTRLAVQRLLAAFDEIAAIESDASTSAAIDLAATYVERAAMEDFRLLDHLDFHDSTVKDIVERKRTQEDWSAMDDLSDPALLFPDSGAFRQFFSGLGTAKVEIGELREEVATLIKIVAQTRAERGEKPKRGMFRAKDQAAEA